MSPNPGHYWVQLIFPLPVTENCTWSACISSNTSTSRLISTGRVQTSTKRAVECTVGRRQQLTFICFRHGVPVIELTRVYLLEIPIHVNSMLIANVNFSLDICCFFKAVYQLLDRFSSSVLRHLQCEEERTCKSRMIAQITRLCGHELLNIAVKLFTYSNCVPGARLSQSGDF